MAHGGTQWAFVSPTTAKELRNWIWYGRGGIRRSEIRWDSKLTYNENSRSYAWLDRKWGEGVPLDVLASEIEATFPWFGIHDEDTLWDWLGENPG